MITLTANSALFRLFLSFSCSLGFLFLQKLFPSCLRFDSVCKQRLERDTTWSSRIWFKILLDWFNSPSLFIFLREPEKEERDIKIMAIPLSFSQFLLLPRSSPSLVLFTCLPVNFVFFSTLSSIPGLTVRTIFVIGFVHWTKGNTNNRRVFFFFFIYTAIHASSSIDFSFDQPSVPSFTSAMFVHRLSLSLPLPAFFYAHLLQSRHELHKESFHILISAHICSYHSSSSAFHSWMNWDDGHVHLFFLTFLILFWC